MRLGQYAADERDDAGMEQKIIMCKNVFIYYVAIAEYFSLADKTCAYALDLLSALLGTNQVVSQLFLSLRCIMGFTHAQVWVDKCPCMLVM